MNKRLCIAGLVSVAVAGCATRPGFDKVSGDPALARNAIVQSVDDDGRPTNDAPSIRPLGQRNDVLLLSGGGSDGAFGAGVLVGWSAAGTRPEFDVVTGVSTGAMMATLAFLGPRHDNDLRLAYTTLTNTDVYKSRGLFGLARHGAYYDSRPLAATVARFVTEQVLDEVAAEYRRGRRLYVGSTDLDAGVSTVWDMGKIAASSSPWRLQLYRQVLVASAAIPGVFPPVYIAKDDARPTLYVDGGVKGALLFRGYMIDPKGANQRVWAIVNGHISYRGEPTNLGANVQSIAGRSISEMLRTITYRTTQRVYTMARNARAQFKLAYIPDDVEETDPIRFDPDEMRKLFEAGMNIGRAGKWASEPPRLERLEHMP